MTARAARHHGGHYETGEDWASFVLVDGLLVTGQNPASSKAAAKLRMDMQASTAALSIDG